MIVTDVLLDRLTQEAKVSERLRQNYDLRNSSEDNSQRMLNALEIGTDISVHRHRKSSETVAVLRGAVRQNFYDDNGRIIETFIVEAGSSVPFFVVPIGAWHNCEALEEGTIIFESKDGKYEPIDMEDILPKSLVLRSKIQAFIEQEARSLSMEVVTAEYVYRMWGGKVSLEDIKEAMKM